MPCLEEGGGKSTAGKTGKDLTLLETWRFSQEIRSCALNEMINGKCQLVYTLSLTTLQEWALFSGFCVKKTMGSERGMPEVWDSLCCVSHSQYSAAFHAGAPLSRLSMITSYPFPCL